MLSRGDHAQLLPSELAPVEAGTTSCSAASRRRVGDGVDAAERQGAPLPVDGPGDAGDLDLAVDRPPAGTPWPRELIATTGVNQSPGPCTLFLQDCWPAHEEAADTLADRCRRGRRLVVLVGETRPARPGIAPRPSIAATSCRSSPRRHAQPLTVVQVGTQVSGTVYRVHVDFNDLVKEGQVLAELDPALLQATLKQSEANLDNAQATLELGPEQRRPHRDPVQAETWHRTRTSSRRASASRSLPPR